MTTLGFVLLGTLLGYFLSRRRFVGRLRELEQYRLESERINAKLIAASAELGERYNELQAISQQKDVLIDTLFDASTDSLNLALTAQQDQQAAVTKLTQLQAQHEPTLARLN